MVIQNMPVITHDLEELLLLVAERVQLPESLDTKARERYRTLTSLLEQSPLGRFPIEVYAQGSYRISTTVKPVSDEDFDLDFIVEVQMPIRPDPQEMMDLVWIILSDNDVYRGMIERKPACIRIKYADGFHMDIVPAVSNPDRGETAIVIPHSKSGSTYDWHETDPKGYASWFTSLPSHRVLAKEMKVEPLPLPQLAGEKTPLQAAVQLYKRNHHVQVGEEHLRTASIVLTTLAGQAGGREATIGQVMTTLALSLQEFDNLPVAPQVLHPAAEYEVLSNKWEDRDVYAVFREHARRFRRDWHELLQLQGTDYPTVIRKLEDMFGTTPVQAAAKAISERRQRARRDNALKTGTRGILTTGVAGLGNPGHTYYGDRTN